MASSQQALIEVTASLNSNKKKEKLDAFERLTALLSQEQIVKYLYENSLSAEKKLSWDIVFIRVHNAALSLIDKSALKNHQMSDKYKQVVQSVILLVIQKSLHQKIVLISSNLIVSCVLAVFESDFRYRILGCTYLNVLCKYVLSERRNWGQLKKENWIGLKDVCKTHLRNSPPGTHCVIFLEILCEVIKNSSKNCQTSSSFLDLFDFVKDIYANYKGLGSNYEIFLLRLTNILCLQLAIEFRYKVCEFTEDIFDFVRNFHRKNNSDLNILVYHFLMTSLSVHNPNGVCDSDKSAYASNSRKWKSQIVKIYFLCQNDIREILKNPNAKLTETELLDLFVDVSHLVTAYEFDTPTENFDEDASFGEPGPNNKRKCSSDGSLQTFCSLNSGKTKLPKLDYDFVNLVTNLQGANTWFWLKFLELLICKYPCDLKHNYHAVVQVLCQLFCDKKDVLNMKTILRCLRCIIEAENTLTIAGADIHCLNDTWSKISSELVRYLRLETCSEAHALLQALINHSKLRDQEHLISLYCSGTLPANVNYFKTLSVMCHNCIMPEFIFSDNDVHLSQKNVRQYLLAWLLNGENKYPCKDFAKLVVSLILKKNEEENVKMVDKEDILITHTNINDFFKSITNNYKTVAFKDVKFTECSKGVEINPLIRVDSGMKRVLLNLLEERWKFVFESLAEKDQSFDENLMALENSYWFCELLCHLLSNVEIINLSAINEQFLLEKLELLLYECSTKTLNLIQVKFFSLGSLFNIYNESFSVKVQKIIREPNFLNLNLLEFLFELFTRHNDEHLNAEFSIRQHSEIKSNSEFSQLIKGTKSIFHFQNLNNTEKLFVYAAELLCQYVALPGLSPPNLYQSTLALKIVEILLNDEKVKTYSNFQLQLILRVVYSFVKFDGISVPVLNGCLDLLSIIFNGKYKEPELMIIILQVLKDLLPLVYRVGDEGTRLKYMKQMEEFRFIVLNRKSCGVKAVCKYIECLAEIFKFDAEGNWAVWKANDLNCKAFEDVLIFLRHPYHEVRLTAAQQIGLLFANDEDVKDSTIDWQKKMLKNLFATLNENEKLLPKDTGYVLEYFLCIISSVSLITWANIICRSKFWRKKAFFYLLHQAFSLKVKSSEVIDILKLISKELKISDHDFPYYIFGHKTLDEFIQRHFRSIVTVYSQSGRLDGIVMISAKLQRPVGEILKECHPMLMSFVLPNLSENADSETCQKAVKLKRFMDEKLPPKGLVINHLPERLDELVFHMIRRMHDPIYLTKLCPLPGNIKDDKSRMGCTGARITETLANLFSENSNSSFEKVVSTMPSIVEKVLSLLMENVEEAIVYEEKIFAFYKYIFFVELISDATKKSLSHYSINSFIIRDVVYSLLAIIRKDEAQTLTNMACECLKKISESYLPNFHEIFGEFLPAIATVLTPLAANSNQKSLEVLNFLICDNYSKLEQNIAFLDPFPSQEIFGEINRQIGRKQLKGRSLESILKHFIKGGNANNYGCRIEGLRYLLKSLSEKKAELKEMYENLTTVRGFSEDCKNSLLHQLICILVELTANKNLTVRTEAGKCLGELGSSDLTTLVLRPENNILDSDQSDSALDNLLQSSLSALSGLMISENFSVKRASSKGLYALLSVRQSKEILRRRGKNFKNFKYLLPFEIDSGEELRIKIRKDIFMDKMCDSDLWKPEDHRKWIVNLMENLLDSLSDSRGVINSYKELIKVHWQFAEDLLPLILDLILSSGDKDFTGVISNNFREFFKGNFNPQNKSQASINKRSVKCMLNVVDYMRIRKNQKGIFQDSCLDVNYLHFAKAALFCSAFFTSIFYVELWFERKRKENYSNVDINTICESFPEEGFFLTEILRECHSKIGNLDGIHGCGYMHLLNVPAEIQHYEHVKNWNLSLLHHDIQLSMGNKEFEEGLINSLDRSGIHYVLNSVVKSSKIVTRPTSVQYRCAAHLSDWSLLDTNSKAISDFDSFDKSYYFALKAFHNEDDCTFHGEIQKARKTVFNELINCSLESANNLYLPLTELQTLKELEDFVSVLRNSNRNSDLLDLHKKWRDQDSIGQRGDFRSIESILINRTVFLKIGLGKAMGKSNFRCDLLKILCETYCDLIVAARKEKKYEIAIRMLSYLNNLGEIPRGISERIKLEKARIFWERGDRQMGRFALSHHIKKMEISGPLMAEGLKIYGDWMAETKSENSREIIGNYYLKSISQSSEDDSHLIDSYASLAKFADGNYEQLNEYLSSPLFEIKQNLVSRQQDLASELRQELGWTQNREKRMAYQIAAKQCVIDENEIKNDRKERDSYLYLALKYYLLTLKEGEKYNMLVFRLVSMWLSNSSNQEVIQQLKKILPKIPTYKFLCLLPQLVPRMAEVCLISDLVERILQDHPHHTLPLLFALNNSYEDLKYGNKETGNFSNPRVQTAKSILEKFKRSQKLEVLISEMEKFSIALIELANYHPTERGSPGNPIDFPHHLKIKRIKNLSSVSVPSLSIPYEKNCRYEGIIGINGFEEGFHLVGGINLPKRIKCIGSDGIGRSLLIKGKDDLRQDAVMQQVFTIMNSLLSQNPETRKRKLIIRTYRVVPLSQRSGIIEWCENTQPLSLYLIGQDGKSGAHKKFYPDDIPVLECRSLIKRVFALPQATTENKLEVFLEICRRLHPVFHYFFVEKFPAAGVWFERRLAYVHSVATSSMIGYILGIGDRHVHNILIDNSTAEVIHIDLGIAFEQGKTLPTPETVPFRLTRDIVDGMGLSGVEGDFRISCVKTMEVLRDNQDTILTLLEVLLYDPLYTWTITPEKAYSMQGQTESGSSTTEKFSLDMKTNKMAERALIRLKQKLQGTEVGCVATNVEGQVSYLVQQARDPNNLCRLFHGWQSYL